MTRRNATIAAALSLSLAAGAGCGGDGGGGGGAGGAAPTGGSVVFTISGEQLALGGYGFPPASEDEPAFVDGWEVKFTEVLVTVDHITLSASPDLVPTDQSKTGALVAQVDGPWAVDLHKGGPLLGKGGSSEQAVQLATVDNQNKNGGKPFAADERYAFGFDVVSATDAATLVNLDDAGKADYQTMKQNGYAVLFVGTATWKGESCTPADPAFDKVPKVVSFKLGFKTPTSYSNCQNPDNDPAEPFDGEEHLRGVAIKANAPVTAQVTIHTDHIFWEAFVHDAPAHFDMIAAQATDAGGTATVTAEDLKGVDPTAITLKDKTALPWRSCLATYTPPSSGQMSFSTGTIPVNPTGDPATSIRDLYDYIAYNVSTAGHLNADGLCAVKRNYVSPP